MPPNIEEPAEPEIDEDKILEENEPDLEAVIREGLPGSPWGELTPEEIADQIENEGN